MPFSQNPEIKRTSQRTNKGIPPNRYEQFITDMPLNHSPQSTASASAPPKPPTIPDPPPQPTEASSKRPVQDAEIMEKNIEKVTHELNKKISELQNEFKRQMHAMQSLVLNNNDRMQRTVSEIRNEMRRVEAVAIPQSIAAATPPIAAATPPLIAAATPPLITAATPPLITAATPHLIAAAAPPLIATATPPLIASSMPAHPPLYDAEPPRHTQRTSFESITNSQQYTAYRQKKIYPLPKFSGLPEEWHTFLEAFESTTQEFEYSSLHNIMRLRDAIEGRARETIDSLLCSSTNVDAIMSILKETYGRPEQLIKSQIQKVRALPTVAEGELAALIVFANQIVNMATFLESVRGDHHLSNPMLLSELVAKLPMSRQMQWAEKCLQLDRASTILDFSQWLAGIRKLANMVTDSLPSTSSAAVSGGRRHLSSAPLENKGRKFACVGIKRCRVCEGECQFINLCKVYLGLSVEDRWKRVKALRVCFICLKNGHQASQCFKRRKCGINGCRYSHHQTLHEATAENIKDNYNSRDAVEPTTSREHRSCHAEANRDDDTVLFQIIPVQIYGKDKHLKIYAFVDDGANATMFDANVAKELGLSGQKDYLELQWLNKKMTRESTEIVDLSISGTFENAKKYKMSKVFVLSSLELPTQSFNSFQSISQGSNEHLSGLPLLSYSNIQPKMIISLTHAFLTVPIDIPRALPIPGPIATKTRLGWMVYGPIGGESTNHQRRSCHINKTSNDQNVLSHMEDMMKNYFDIENFGVKPNLKAVKSKFDEKAMSILESTTKRCGERYESGLLWIEQNVTLPDSFQMVLSRLESIERKMARDPEYASDYKSKINEYIRKGYARKLSSEESRNRTSKTFYIPHFGVRNPNKRGIRIVFDAAAEINGISLNKKLLTGPDLNQPLISLLFKFRQSPIAVCGDIKEMFHQVKILKEDQDAQRFLWRNGNSTNQLETYVMTRMIFGATCSPTMAQYVKNKNAHRFALKYPRAVEGILEKHYVDDYVDCFQTEEEALKVLKEVIMIHQAGGFDMRNIVSNSEEIKRHFGNSEEDSPVSVEGTEVDRILGMHWLSKTDEFSFILKFNKVPADILTFKRKPTKREMLSVTMSIFDPFGLLQNFTVCGKILLQAVWKAGIQWDEQLPDFIYKKWRSWLEELPRVEKYRISRCYSPSFVNKNVDLHVFCDASEEAVAAVAYWRFEDAMGIRLSFVAAKTSCTPTRFQTIPRLELQAAVLAARLKDTILNFHNANVGKCVLWSDSHTVVRWIRSDHRVYKQFVANRVSEILEYTTVEDWRWCPGELNPADEATRAKFPIRYNPDSKWKNGPAFLLCYEQNWPDESCMKSNVDKSSEEFKSKHILMLTGEVSAIIPKINRFSSYSRLKRTMAWILRYCTNLKRKISRVTLIKGELTSAEEEEAEMHLCRQVQQDAFLEELSCLSAKKVIPNNSSLKTLNPYLDEQRLLRVSGRLENAICIPLAARRPIILPKNHKLTRLIVNAYHQNLSHLNTDTAICEIRQKFWIPSIRTLVRSVEAQCTFCKVRKAKPEPPQMGYLPPDRVTPYVRPFSYTGLDFFGPIDVSIGRRREKRWVALFTCLAVRAVHLEIAANLSSDACLLCIRNFINRRGVPIQIRSDNGTNFIGLSKELRGTNEFLDNDKMNTGLAPLGIKWKFNTPSNPSAGGSWERLVQSVKKSLFIMLKEHAPRLETLHSLLIEAENIVNSRPLTHLPVTPDDPEPLTPNHFLLGCSNSTQTPAPFEPRLLCLRKQWKVLQNLKNGYWKRWIREYLPDLTRRTKWCLPKEPINVGSLVLICDDNAPRSQWRRGRILSLLTGKDGVARSAEVNTINGALKRPISKLAVLDVEQAEDDMGESPPTGSSHEGGDVMKLSTNLSKVV